jgi:2-dehydro-3-deoxyphosphogluconate aldolase/(4S)-4-hydroxy-2-oxoglutarate aldolase
MHALFRGTSVVPVLTIARAADAVPLAGALAEGGLRVIEVEFRTPSAAAALAAITGELPYVVAGAGGLQRPVDVARAKGAGARFLVSPGITAELVAAALATGLPYLPGVATPSEIMLARDLGICVMNLFPAAALGGLALLRSLAPVFPGIAFRPAGGLDEDTAADYLALPNVPMVGGCWMAPPEVISAGEWARVRRLAARAVTICRPAAA